MRSAATKAADATAGRTGTYLHSGAFAWVRSGAAGGARQALLARALDVIDIRQIDAVLGHAAGELLARAKQDDVIDAALVLLANDGDRVITSDPQDLALLARAADLDVEIVTP